MTRPVATMGKAATALITLAAAVLVARLRPFKVSESSVFQPAPVVTRPPAAPEAAADYHEPLSTYTLSTTALQLRPASPQHQPATHVARLPLAGVAPLTSATFMPSDLGVLSSRGYETYMTRTVDFFKNQALIHRLLEEWEAAGWKDPWSGTVTQPDTLLMCGRTVARRRGYARGTVAAQAAAAHRPNTNISTLAASMGVASLRTRCPQSVLLTRAGSGAAAVADVLDVVLLPGDGAPASETVELLLRVVDNPRIVAEHDPGHPVQVLEGDGNHYHFVLPGDATIDAASLLKEVEALPSINTTPEAYDAGAWGLVLKLTNCATPALNTPYTFSSSVSLIQPGSQCSSTTLCNAAALTGTGAPSCSVTDTTRASCQLVGAVQVTSFTCTYTMTCTFTTAGQVAVTVAPAVSSGNTATTQICPTEPSSPPPPPSPPPPSPPPPSPPPPSPPPPPSFKCKHGYSIQGLPSGSYSTHCAECCFNRHKHKLICGTCSCSSAGKRCKSPFVYQVPRHCTNVTYAPSSNRFGCMSRSRQG